MPATLLRLPLAWIGVLVLCFASPLLAQGSAVGNLVFADSNSNGHYDSGEGVAGVTVELWQATGDEFEPYVLADSKVTLGSGAYLFEGLADGTYFVRIPESEFAPGEPMAGLLSLPDQQLTGDDDDGEDGLDSSFPAASGINTIEFVVTAGDAPNFANGETGFDHTSDDADDLNTDLTVDFGFFRPVGLGNLVFADTNGNGRADTGEGIPGVVVQLFHGADDPSTAISLGDVLTSETGQFQFGALLPGAYKLHVPASQFASGGQLEGATSIIGIGGALDDDDASGAGHLGDDGVDSLTPATMGITSGVVTLVAGGAPTTLTGETGQAANNDDAVDADYDLTVDFGFVFTPGRVAVGNLVYLDGNGNGHFDEGEGVGGVKVQLFASGQNPLLATALDERATRDDGTYAFVDLLPGSYFVHVPSSEFAFGKPLFAALSMTGTSTGDDNLGEDGLDVVRPDVDGVSTGVFDLVLGAAPTAAQGEVGYGSGADSFRDDQVDLTHDLGFVLPRSVPLALGNLVFADVNRNGKLDAGEPGISGVELRLFREGDDPEADSSVASLVTQPDGSYLFSGLTAGRYFVHVPATEFAVGRPLHGMLSSPGNGSDDQQDDDDDENGIDEANPAAAGLSSVVVALAVGAEPIESGFAAAIDDLEDANVNLTLDLGFAVECPVLNITPAIPASPTAQAYYTITFALTGSNEPVTWSLQSGALPAGMTLSSAGQFSGTPALDGSYTFTVRAQTADNCVATLAVNLTVNPPTTMGVGNLVYVDSNLTGRYEPGEGVTGVTLKLFREGDDPLTATPVKTTTSNLQGFYAFYQLTAGRYFVHLPNTNFTNGAPLYQKLSLPGNGGDVGLDDTIDENGIDAPTPAVSGISSNVFELQPGTEPMILTGEGGFQNTVDNAHDEDIDFTIDFGFTPDATQTASLGNVVFRDDNGNRVYNANEGVDGVKVLLFEGTADPMFDPVLRTTYTANGGRYLFGGLAEGSYLVFIPPSEFAKDKPLYGCLSVTGNGVASAKDDDVDEDGIDNAVPAANGIASSPVTLTLGAMPGPAKETGADGTSDDARDTNSDLTVDLGFVRNCGTILVAPGGLPSAPMREAYQVQITASGGASPYVYSKASGTLPQGLALTSNGLLSGTPMSYGSYQFGVQVIDDYGCVVVKSYTLEVVAPPLGVGNVVFFDRDGSGSADVGEGVDGVTVQLYRSAQTPGTDTPVAQAVTSSGGYYLFDNLAPGLYVVHLPKAMFGTGAPLWHMRSAAGVMSSGDDESGEDGQDSIDPVQSGISTELFALEPGQAPAGSAESGLSGASDDVRDGDIDLTRDFGVVDSTALPATFAAWQGEHPGVGGPTGNGDGDVQSNLIEYALGGDPSTGAQSGQATFAVVENQANGQMRVQLRRRHGGQGDLSYAVQVLNNLSLSPGGWQPTQLVPTIVNNGDGTETLTYGPLENDPALGSGVQTGFVRVRVTLDANHDTVAEATADSIVLGWQKRTLQQRNQTYAVPFTTREVFSGLVDSVGVSSVSVGASLGSVNVSSLLSSGYEYYLEVIGGDAEGQRWEVDEVGSSGATLALLPAHARSTSTTLPANLVGDLIALRPHWRVVDLFPVGDFRAASTSGSADNLLFWDNATSSYITLWLVSTNPARWLKVGGGATLYDNMVVGPCDGLFTKPKAGVVNAGAAGQVRRWKVANPLKSGYNFIGNPYPQAQSANQRVMTTANGFSGGLTQASADRVLVWTADVGTTTGYETYYLLKNPSIERWLKSGSGSTDQGNTKIFGSNTAVFLISQLGNPNWILTPSWSP